MKTLGIVQFQQKKFKLLGLKGEFADQLGDLPTGFQMIVWGNSGNGKTEYCIRLAKSLANYGKVAWLSYEQGHGYDLQKAINRNKMGEVSGKFYIIDPNSQRKAGKSYLEELDDYLSARNSPNFIFIDSVDYTRFSFDDYDFLKKKYGHNKGFIFISHAEGKHPKSAVGKRILYDGGMGFYVNKFISVVEKNRFGGEADFIIYEKRARELNPAYFLAKVKASSSAKQGVLNVDNHDDNPEKMHIPPSESEGVNAENTPETKPIKAPKTPVEA
jgi:hypothetical protein